MKKLQIKTIIRCMLTFLITLGLLITALVVTTAISNEAVYDNTVLLCRKKQYFTMAALVLSYLGVHFLWMVKSAEYQPAILLSQLFALLFVLFEKKGETTPLGACIKEAQDYIEKAGLFAEILIADNGSTDVSVTIAKEAGARAVFVP